jgi:hypothetical protein
MKLIRARVQNFRSIVDSGEVDVEDSVTVLIGKNEQGKTNFLKGMASFNNTARYFPKDFPNHMRKKLEESPPAEIPMVSLWFAPGPAERRRLEALLKKEHVVARYRVTRYYDGHYEYRAGDSPTSPLLEFASPDLSALSAGLAAEASGLRTRLSEHSVRAESFAPSLDQLNTLVDAFTSTKFASAAELENLVNTFSTSLAGLPGQDPPIQEEIAGTVKRLEAKKSEITRLFAADPVAGFFQLLPTFVLHSSTTDRIPDEVNAADFVSSPETTSKGMASLCKIAGLTIKKIQELASSLDVSQREAYEDHFNASIEGGINEFWTQARYGVHFRLGESRLSVSISDDLYSPRIAPSQRSDGFQWYLSFYSTLLSESSGTRPSVLLLDNPGLELHPDGQHDIKRFLEEKLPRLVQVMYVTHSPAMIDPSNLEQVRLVKRTQEADGTKVANWAYKEGTDADLLEPVRSAIGASLVSSLMFSDDNILVEGAADKPILEGAFGILHKDRKRKIQVNGSISETPNGFLPRFYERSALSFVVFVDADDGGRDLMANLKKWGIGPEKILGLGDVFSDRKDRDFELEDIFGSDFYHTAVQETYPDKPVEKPGDNKKKRTKTYEALFQDQYGFGFSKKRVADTLKRMLLAGRGDEESLNALKKLTDAHLNKLDKKKV